MKRFSGLLMLLAAAGGCVSTDGGGSPGGGGYMSGVWNRAPDGASNAVHAPQTVSNMVGPYGQQVAVTAPGGDAMTGSALARAVLVQSFPGEVLQQINFKGPVATPEIVRAAGVAPPAGAMAGAMPPAGMMAPPAMGAAGGMPMTLPGSIAPPGMPAPAMGPMPGVPAMPGGPTGIAGAVAAVGALNGGGPGAGFPAQRTEVRFVGPAGMKISWFAPKADGKPGFGANFLEAPGRYNFLQCAIYRLKLSEIPQHPGLELYPTLEVVPCNGKTAAFLAHSAVPVSFTEEDLEQVRAGNFVVKVIYLPDPQFQDLAATGPDEVVSSRLEPGVDPIVEAQRRGSIMAIVRLGNIDLEAPNTPAMDAPPPGAMISQNMMPGMPPALAGRMAPYGAAGMRQPMMPNPMQMRGPQSPVVLPPAMPPTAATPQFPANPGLPPVPAIPTSQSAPSK